MNPPTQNLKTLSVLFAACLGILPATAQPTGQWDFDNGNLNSTVGQPLVYLDGAGGPTQQGTQFGTTTSFGIPSIGGQEARVMKFPACTAPMGFVIPTPANPNGGGAFVNDWTIVFDILYPAESHNKWRAFIETDGRVIKPDAEFFVSTNNAIGINGQYDGTIASNTWYRVGFVVEGSTATIRKYINGVEVGRQSARDGGTPALDGRWALTPSSAGGTAELFNDDNGDVAIGYVNSIQLRDVALTKAQMLALGGPAASGVPQTIPPIPSGIEQWIPRGAFAGRNTDVGVVINQGSTTIQDSSITLKLDGTTRANPSITRQSGLITVLSPNSGLFAASSKHTIEITFTDSLAGQRTLSNSFTAALFYEDFEGLTLGPAKDETGVASLAIQKGWTNQPPPGWSIDNSQFKSVVITPDNPDNDGDGYADLDGRTEWAGWSFANKDFWVAADNQTRDQFTRASGTIAVADNDEWDDLTHLKGFFNSFLKTPEISLDGIGANTAFLQFDSSWRPESLDDVSAADSTTGFPGGPNGEAINDQTAIITVSFDGGVPIRVLKYDSIPSSPTFKPDAQNESVLLPLNNPAGAKKMVLSFEMRDAANDWWWAVDNIVINAGATPPVISSQPIPVEANEGSPASLVVTASGSGATYQWFKGQGTNKTVVTGATSATLSFAAAKVEDAGYYSAEIKNAVGSVTSVAARLTVLPKSSGRLTLLNENFDTVPLGANIEEGIITGSGGEKPNVWTKTPPSGWSIDDTSVPGVGTAGDGVTEWAGWSFADRAWWAQTTGDQQRTQFLKAKGGTAIADSDEWDDVSHDAGNMATYLKSRVISLEGVKAGSVILQFDSSWRAEEPQKANVMVSFDGAAPVVVLRFESATTSPNYHPDEVNETIAVRISNPAGAKNMVLTFGYFDTRNNWWWAIDNLLVLGEPVPPPVSGLTDGLVAHLKFDGDLSDSSGHGNSGTKVGNPGFGTGKIGSGALVFTSKKDGSSFNYVTLGTPADLNFSSNVNFTVSFWAKLTNWAGDPSLIGNKDWGSGNNRGWVIATAGDGHIQWNLGGTLAGASGNRKDFDGPGGTFSTNGIWRHIAVTFDRVGNGITYVDGLKLAQPNGTSEIAIGNPPNDLGTPTGQAVNIGQDGKGTYTDGGSVEVNDGMIDDLAIWRRALSASEVTQVFTLGQAGQDAESKLITDDLVLHLTFDGDLSDSSGHGNSGTKVGNPGFGTGKIGSGALVFTSKKDGSSFNYVTLGTPADLNFSSNVNFTVSFWAKLTNWAGDPSLIGNKDWGSGNNRGWVLAADSDGRIQWNLGGTLAGASGDRKDYDGPGGTFTNGGWHHIVATFDRAGNGATYVDGAKLNHRDGRAEIPIATPPNDLGTPTGQAVNIGQDGKGTYTDGGSVEVNGGMIDDVAIWRRALSVSEVAAMYQRGQQGINVVGKSAAAEVRITGTFASGNLTFTWTGASSLEQADEATGPWTPSSATSGQPIPTTAAKKFYRLKQP